MDKYNLVVSHNYGATKMKNELKGTIDQESYVNLLCQIKNRVRVARFSAMQKVNAELILLYWDLGKVIFEAQAKQGWGKGVVEQLEADLKEGNPANLGLSARNLWYTLKFYNTYQHDTILQQLTAEIGCGVNVAASFRKIPSSTKLS